MKEYNLYDNSLISLEEDNYHKGNETNNKRKINNTFKDTTSDSFFKKLINSFSKIGKGLKNIMSMKINIEDDNNYNKNTYDLVSNRFNNNEEISLIDAPSFIEESPSFNKSNIQNIKKIENNESEDKNKMIISHNETKRDILDDERLDINNSFLKSDKGEEIINTDILKDHNNKKIIKTSFLNKKRGNVYFEEEKSEIKENNDKEEIIKSKKKQEDIIYNKNNNIISNKNNNKSEEKNRLNSSIMSLSMKSLDNIKKEINQRREENLNKLNNMYKKHGLNYDYIKEQQIREKILVDYYKEKTKRTAEEKLKAEREKRKREEEFQKLKIRKVSGLKYASIIKKPKILSQTKNTEIQFSGQPSKPNNTNVTFGNINNFDQSIDNKVKENNKKENISILGNNINKGNDTDKKPLLSSFDNKKDKESTNKIFDNKKQSIFGNLLADNKEKEKEQKSENNQSNEKKETQNLFSGLTGNLFGDKTPPISFNFNTGITNNNPEKKIEENQNINNKGNEQPTQTQSLFGNNIFTTDSGFNAKQNIFSTSKNDKSESIFFGNTDINNNNKKRNQNEGGFFSKKEEGGLFNQQTNVSSSINDDSLFKSNQPENKGQNNNSFLTSNQSENKGQNNNSLLSANNSFLINSSKPVPSLFGNSQPNNDNIKQPQTQNLFGNNAGGNFSLFENNKSLFG